MALVLAADGVELGSSSSSSSNAAAVITRDTTEKKKEMHVSSLSGKLHIWLPKLFNTIGCQVARSPWRYLLTTCLVSLTIGTGALRTKVDTSWHNWYPQRSRAWVDFQFQTERFGDGDLAEVAIFTTVGTTPDAPAAVGVLERDTLLSVLDLYDRVSSSTGRFDDVCARSTGATGECLVSSILSLWGYDRGVISSLTQDYILGNVSQSVLFAAGSGEPLLLEALLGGVVYGEEGVVSAADALMLTFSVDGEASGIAEFEEFNFLAACRAMATELAGDSHVYCYSSGSYSLEADRAVEEDQSIMMFAMILMIGYVTFVLGRCGDAVHSKMFLGLTIIVTVGLSLAVAFGICGFLGIPYTQLSGMAIFIILGVGIDDMFILVDAFARQPEGCGGAERLSGTLADVGGSITLTSVTDFLAFLCGSLIDLPAVSYFCILAGIAVLAVFVVQVTFFAAAMSLDNARAEAGRYDLAPCFTAAAAAAAASGAREPQKLNKSRRRALFLRLATFIVHPPHTVAIALAFFAAGATMAQYGLRHVGKGVERSDFLPTGSYVADFLSARDEYFGEIDALDIVTTQPLDMEHEQDVERFRDLLAAVESLEFAMGQADCWFSAWQDWQKNSTDPLASSPSHFLLNTTAGGRFVGDVVFEEEGKVVAASRCRILFLLYAGSDANVEQMDAARRATDSVPGLSASPFNRNFLWLERYRQIDQLTLTTLLAALCGVFLVSAVFLGASVALLITVCVSMINLNLIGVMALWDVRVNVASLVIMVLAIGFSVDYSAHIAEGFTNARSKGKPAREAVISSLTELGVSVLNGGLSTLLAVLLLALSKSEGFRVLFKMFLGMVTFGLLHGLVFLPSLLLIMSWRQSK